MKASTTICRLVLSFLSQFFQSRRHFSSQAKDRYRELGKRHQVSVCGPRLANQLDDAHGAILACVVLPGMSPTVGLNWARANRKVRCIGLL